MNIMNIAILFRMVAVMAALAVGLVSEIPGQQKLSPELAQADHPFHDLLGRRERAVGITALRQSTNLAIGQTGCQYQY